jgi:hypothetical protein
MFSKAVVGENRKGLFDFECSEPALMLPCPFAYPLFLNLIKILTPPSKSQNACN